MINQRGLEMKVIKSKEINHRPKVSVLISTYNKEKFISTTLDSVLKQTMNMKDFEVIVVDDCSTDQTFDIVGQKQKALLTISLFNQIKIQVRQRKPRNLSIELSKGKYILFIDGDDWLPEDALEKLYTLLKQIRQIMLLV